MKKNIALFAMVILAAMLWLPAKAQAVELIDFDKRGSLCITVTDPEKKPMSGTEVTLYKVADIVPDQTVGYKLSISKDFAEGNFDMFLGRDDIDNTALTEALENYVSQNHISGEKQRSNDSGQVAWENMDLGVYFLTNTIAADEYTQVSSFCVTIPNLVGDTYLYDVQATPKSVTVTPVPPTPVPPPLPQTGQLWWPVPVLAMVGCGLIGVGVSIKKRHTDGQE